MSDTEKQQFNSGDPEKPPLPEGDFSTGEVVVVPQQQVEVRWNWCHVVTSVFGYFCCQPFGLISLVMAMLAYSDHKAKDYTRSRHKRKMALGFGVTAIVLGTIFTILFCIGMVCYMKRMHHYYHDKHGSYEHKWGKWGKWDDDTDYMRKDHMGY